MSRRMPNGLLKGRYVRWESACHTLGARTVRQLCWVLGGEDTDHWPVLFFAQREGGLREMTSKAVVRVG